MNGSVSCFLYHKLNLSTSNLGRKGEGLAKVKDMPIFFILFVCLLCLNKWKLKANFIFNFPRSKRKEILNNLKSDHQKNNNQQGKFKIVTKVKIFISVALGIFMHSSVHPAPTFRHWYQTPKYTRLAINFSLEFSNSVHFPNFLTNRLQFFIVSF